MITLYIDTSSSTKAEVSLSLDGNVFKEQRQYDKDRAQIVLPMINALLKEHNMKLQDVTGIEVVVGPGSFTGLRVGVAIANSLGFFLGIPINDNPPGTLVEPQYT